MKKKKEFYGQVKKGKKKRKGVNLKGSSKEDEDPTPHRAK